MSPAKSFSGVARQFASAARLFSATEFACIRAAHVGIIGLGGVGSWAAEAIVRSGVGAVTLVDMDHVAESNLNRQIQALHSTLGMPKCGALGARLSDISPDCRVFTVDDFLTVGNAAAILGVDPTGQRQGGVGRAEGPAVWIDATDDFRAKRTMIIAMTDAKRSQDLIVSGAAGGKTDPGRTEAADLSDATQDPLLSALRYDLRKHAGFPRQGRMKVPVVFNRQPMIRSENCDPSAKLACAGYGSLVTVTATMGMVAAQMAIIRICKR
jgi:tRNA A37 threonylcarbamoyladenosine dehydratase